MKPQRAAARGGERKHGTKHRVRCALRRGGRDGERVAVVRRGRRGLTPRRARRVHLTRVHSELDPSRRTCHRIGPATATDDDGNGVARAVVRGRGAPDLHRGRVRRGDGTDRAHAAVRPLRVHRREASAGHRQRRRRQPVRASRRHRERHDRRAMREGNRAEDARGFDPHPVDRRAQRHGVLLVHTRGFADDHAGRHDIPDARDLPEVTPRAARIVDSKRGRAGRAG